MSLSDIATIIGRGIAPKYDDQGDMLVLNQRCIQSGRLDFGPARWHNSELRKVGVAKRIAAGDVLVNSTGVGTLGRTAPVRKVEVPTTVDSHVTVIRPALQTDAVWLGYALLNLEPEIEFMAEGSTGQTELSSASLASLPIFRPSAEVQRAIGEVLGALDDKIAANRQVSVHAEKLAAAIMGKCTQSVRLGDVARQRRSSVSPDRLGTETVLHFSLPAYDAGRAMLESASEIKSAKNEIGDPTVLVSKLNPRIPRLWPIDIAASGARRLASMEFVALESSDFTVGELWASILQGDAFGQLQALVGGTSNSHQRVRPQDVLDVVVPDPRELGQEDRSALVTLCRLRNQVVEENVILSQTRDELLPLLMNGRITVEDAEKAAEGVL